MNGFIAQIVALACHGNAFLAGRSSGSFFPTNSTCVFCDKINFAKASKLFFIGKKGKEIAATPDEWFKYLASRGAQGIRLSNSPQYHPYFLDRIFSRSSDAGSWAMEVLFKNGQSQYWIVNWNVWNQEAPQNKIWRVTYQKISEGSTPHHAPSDLEKMRSRFLISLSEIRKFSAEHDCKGFTECFQKALDTLGAPQSRQLGYHKDLAPPGALSECAAAILDACQCAWVSMAIRAHCNYNLHYVA